MEMLLEHPDIVGPDAPEPALHFFDGFCAREMTDEDVAAYHARFGRRARAVAGEWTARYMFDQWTPPLIARAAPEAKLLVLVSDPVERYRARLDWIRKVAAAAPDEELYVADYLTDAARRGRYAAQLRALHAFVGPERILVQQLERCQADPVAEYRRTLRFLGVSEDHVPRRLRRSGPTWPVRALHALGVPEGALGRARRAVLRRPEPPPPAVLWPDVEASLREELAEDVAALPALAPHVDLSLWPSFHDAG
jgi:hypothetical protein